MAPLLFTIYLYLMFFKKILLSALISIPLFLTAQTKQVVSANQIWMSYNNTTRITNKWGIWADYQVKTKDAFFNNTDIIEKTLGVIYYPNETVKFTGAFTKVDLHPTDGRIMIVPEYRPWQMIQWQAKTGNIKWASWIRLEERFKTKVLNNTTLANDYDFSYRLRYNVFSQLPITKKKYQRGAISLVASNEIYLNFGKSIVYNVFDQNRVFGGLFFYTSKRDFLQFGYTKSYQQLSAGNKFKSIDAIKISFFNNLDFRRKKA